MALLLVKGRVTTILCSQYILVKHTRTEIAAAVMLCRSWSCPICKPRRIAQLQAQCLSGKPDTFITLTTNPAMDSTRERRAASLGKAWREIRRRACKHYGYDKIPFIAVMEATKRGEPHLHILARCRWIDQAWLSQQMRELINAPICDIRRVGDQGRAANYIAKYCGEAPHKFGTSKRYWCSQDWDLSPWKAEHREEDGWCVWETRDQSIECFRLTLIGMGFKVRAEKHWTVGERLPTVRPEVKAQDPVPIQAQGDLMLSA